MATVMAIAGKIYFLRVLGARVVNQTAVQGRMIEHAGIGVIERHRVERVRDPVRDRPVSAFSPAQRCQPPRTLQRCECTWRAHALI